MTGAPTPLGTARRILSDTNSNIAWSRTHVGPATLLLQAGVLVRVVGSGGHAIAKMASCGTSPATRTVLYRWRWQPCSARCATTAAPTTAARGAAPSRRAETRAASTPSTCVPTPSALLRFCARPVPSRPLAFQLPEIDCRPWKNPSIFSFSPRVYTPRTNHDE